MVVIPNAFITIVVFKVLVFNCLDFIFVVLDGDDDNSDGCETYIVFIVVSIRIVDNDAVLVKSILILLMLFFLFFLFFLTCSCSFWFGYCV